MRYLLFLLIGVLAVAGVASVMGPWRDRPMALPGACTGELVIWRNGEAEPVVMVYTVSVSGGTALIKYLDGRKQQFALRKIKFDPVRIVDDSPAHAVVSTRIDGIYGNGSLPARDTLFLGLARGDKLVMSFTRHERGLYALYFNTTPLGYCLPVA